MALFRFLVAITSILGFSHQLGFAFPTISPNSLVARDVACDDISIYTTQFFLDNTINPPTAFGLFFLGKWMKSAIEFAHTEGNNYITIWDIWDCKYYNKDIDDLTNPLRCIFSNQITTEIYIVNMSITMAMLCEALSFVITSNTTHIKQDGIWGQIVQPTLELPGSETTQVDQIGAIDPYTGELYGIWVRGGVWVRSNETVAVFNTPTKRNDNTDYCYTPERLVYWFGDINW